MKTLFCWLAAICLVVLPTQLYAQTDETGDDTNVVEQGPIGLWLPEGAMRNLLNTVSDELSNQISLDEDQRYLTREVFQDRVYSWLDDNRDELIDLTNIYLESILGDEPPTAEEVAAWANRAKPLAEGFENLVMNVSTDMGAYMTDDQIATMDVQMAVFRVAMGFFRQRLDVWGDGGFDPQRDWPKGGQFDKDQEIRQAELNKELAAAREKALKKALGDRQLLRHKDPWEKEVEAFIKKYEFNNAQIIKANGFLKDAIDRRDQFLKRNERIINELETKLASNISDKEREACLKAYDEKAATIERQRVVLMQKLAKLPTLAQKLKAAEKEKKAESTTQKTRLP